METTYDRNGDFKRMIDKLLMPKAYVEVLEILQHIPIEDYNKMARYWEYGNSIYYPLF